MHTFCMPWIARPPSGTVGFPVRCVLGGGYSFNISPLSFLLMVYKIRFKSPFQWRSSLKFPVRLRFGLCIGNHKIMHSTFLPSFIFFLFFSSLRCHTGKNLCTFCLATNYLPISVVSFEIESDRAKQNKKQHK